MILDHKGNEIDVEKKPTHRFGDWVIPDDVHVKGVTGGPVVGNDVRYVSNEYAFGAREYVRPRLEK